MRLFQYEGRKKNILRTDSMQVMCRSIHFERGYVLINQNNMASTKFRD